MDDSQYQVFPEYFLRLCCINCLPTTDRPLCVNSYHRYAVSKRAAGYHRRSLVETTTVLGQDPVWGGQSAYLFESQVTEALFHCLVVNRMTEFVMHEGCGGTPYLEWMAIIYWNTQAFQTMSYLIGGFIAYTHQSLRPSLYLVKINSLS